MSVVAARSSRGWLLVSAVATALLFAPTLLSYPVTWSGGPYSHGYLVAITVPWLLWRARSVLLPRPAIRGEAVATGVCVSLLWLVSWVAGIGVLAQGFFPLAMLCWGIAVFDSQAERDLVNATVVFLLVVPVWDALVPPLQLLTTLVSGSVARLLDPTAVVAGTTIRIASGSFLVEGGCSGLNFLMSGVTIATIYGVVHLRGWQARLGLIGAAAAIAIVGNWLRVTILVSVGHFSAMQSDLMTSHRWLGWVIFTFGLAVLLPVARALEGREARHSDAGAPPMPDAEGADADAPSSEDRRERTRRRSTFATVLGASAAVGVGPLFLYASMALPMSAFEPDAILPPDEGWSASDGRPVAWTPAFQGADTRLRRTFTDGTTSVVVDHLVYADQRQGAELIGYLNRIAAEPAIAAERLVGPVGRSRRYLNEAIVREDGGFRLVWYWYRVGGIETASPLKAKLLEVPAFVRRRASAELIAVSAACAPRSCDAASTALTAFLASSP